MLPSPLIAAEPSPLPELVLPPSVDPLSPTVPILIDPSSCSTKSKKQSKKSGVFMSQKGFLYIFPSAFG
jgi:hypothetical protein